MKCTEFNCDQDLSKYTDSMLFDSNTNIATGIFEHEGKTVTIYLDVCGEVSVTYKDEVYHSPSEFPDELINLIKAHPNDWMYYSPSGEGNDDAEGDIYVTLNNWFEYLYDGDGDVCEEDIATTTPDTIKGDMEYIAARYFGIDGCYGARSEACLHHCTNCD